MERREALKLLSLHSVTVEADPDPPEYIVHKLGICMQTELECTPCVDERAVFTQLDVPKNSQACLWQA